MSLFRTSSLVILLLVTGACSTLQKSQPASTVDPSLQKKSPLNRQALTREQALTRSRQITSLSTTLWLGLDATHDDYQGRTVIAFELREKARDVSPELILDFEAGEKGTLHSIKLNGNNLDVSLTRYDGYHLYFPLREFLPGTNRIELSFSHAYGTPSTGGLVRFEDPATHEVFIYSDLGLFRAHKMFPCFDQPDLKSNFEVSADTPENWVASSITAEKESKKVDGRLNWVFSISPLIPPYAFALHAGPFQIWKSEFDGIPLRVLYRANTISKAAAQLWFNTSARILSNLSDELETSYPFSKLDFVLAPGFDPKLHGGEQSVEAAAAPIFDEALATQFDELPVLETTAHMWFGNTVTMRWWNGLWQKEGLARLYAHLNATNNAPRNTKALPFKLYRLKNELLQPALQAISHPQSEHMSRAIDSSVSHTELIEQNLDPVTYAESTAAFLQLRLQLGEDDFKEVLRRFFKRFQFRNATLADWVRTLNETTGKDWQEWAKLWFQTPGINHVKAELKCTEDGKLESLFLVQSSLPLRTHAIELRVTQQNIQTPVFTIYSGERTEVKNIESKKCPSKILLNSDLQDFVLTDSL